MNILVHSTVFCIFWVFMSFANCSSLTNDEPKPPTDCGSNSTHPTGLIQLTQHDLPLHECRWNIDLTNSNKTNSSGINLFFEILYLHDDDEVTLYKTSNLTKPLLEKPIRAQNGSLTIVTHETELTIVLKGNATSYFRTLQIFYQSQKCAITVPPVIKLLHSPILVNMENETEIECEYTFVKDTHQGLPVFVFEEFNFTKSSVEIESASIPSPYRHDPPTDFFPEWTSGKSTMVITTRMLVNSTEYYRLKIYHVDPDCSGHHHVVDAYSHRFASPPYVLNNGSIINECLWIFELNDDKILGLVLESVYFNNVKDIISINDGASELSLPLLQVTASSKNQSMRQMIRSTGRYMWISFKPTTFASSFLFNVTAHDQGGYFKNNGTISARATTGNDTIFLLEVEDKKVVYLNFSSSAINPPGMLSIYDGFDTNNLLASLQGNIWYPVLGKSSRLMAIATGFITSTFLAEFKGVEPGCLQMSTLTAENYVLNESCNTTCQWIIPPQDTPNSMLLLDLQYISLKNKDKIEIVKLDSTKTLLGSITSNVSSTPKLVVEASIGVLVKTTQGNCEKNSDRVVLIGHSSYMPACGQNISPIPSDSFLITSPRYPDTYPLLAKCVWNISLASGNFLHLTFNSLKLAPGHCMAVAAEQKTYQFSGSELPNDMLLKGQITIEFDSKNCKKTAQAEALISDVGFVLKNTVFDCGAVLETENGEFNTSTIGNKSLCVWFISVPLSSSDDDSVNIISYTVVKKDDLSNYDLQIYDGGSVRDELKRPNMTSSGVWSRSNNMIIVYKRLNALKPSSIFVFKYTTISCNSSMQCKNKICLHPDWRCNGINDCGDFSDEESCASVPIPPKKITGYSSVQFWCTTFGMIVLGVFAGAAAYHIWLKKRNGQYARFSDISVIE